MDTKDLSHPASAPSFATWSVPETPLAVECSVVVLDELRAAAMEGLQALLRGGLEMGGVLFGTAGQNRVRIVAWRPIACEHAQGPTLALSQKDRIDLARLLETAGSDLSLRGLDPVGWFVSHTRSAVCLTASDVEVYSTFFPSRRQVTLVLRPEKAGSCRAGFFVRDEDGRVRSDASYREFSIEPADHAPAVHPPVRTPASVPPPIPKPDPVPEALAPPRPAPRALPSLPPLPPRAPSRAATGSSRSKWLWALLISVALIGGAVFYFLEFWRPDRSFSLQVADHNGQLSFEWDKTSPSIQGARGSSIEVTDNGATQRFPLTSDQLQAGTFSYARHSGTVSARMMVIREDGSVVEETANFAGATLVPEGPSQEVLSLRAERDELKAEVQRLRDQAQKKKPRSRKR